MKIIETKAYNLSVCCSNFYKKLRFFFLNSSKSYDHSGRVMVLTKFNESGYAIKNVQMLLWCNSFWISNVK